MLKINHRSFFRTVSFCLYEKDDVEIYIFNKLPEWVNCCGIPQTTTTPSQHFLGRGSWKFWKSSFLLLEVSFPGPLGLLEDTPFVSLSVVPRFGLDILGRSPIVFRLTLFLDVVATNAFWHAVLSLRVYSLNFPLPLSCSWSFSKELITFHDQVVYWVWWSSFYFCCRRGRGCSLESISLVAEASLGIPDLMAWARVLTVISLTSLLHSLSRIFFLYAEFLMGHENLFTIL